MKTNTNSHSTLFVSEFPTALGPFAIAVSGDGAVVAAAFGKVEALRPYCPGAALVADEQRTAATREQLIDYLAGRRETLSLRVALHGTPFQQRVWMRLRKIPRGNTASYGQLARELSSSARAVGRANATNPVCVVIPCHRVIGADGSLTGFAFGEAMKRRLLELEGVRVAR